jgi:septum formation protein
MSEPAIYLASGSPRRRELLEQIGVPYAVLSVTVDEARRAREAPRAMVLRLARAKAQAGWGDLTPAQRRPVLGADTVVVVNGTLLGKPRDKAQALAMLAQLSGRAHEVFTGVAVVNAQGMRRAVSRSVVRFRVISEAERRAYWASGEPCDKAGAYAVQGLGAMFIKGIEGSYSGIMGLPLFETAKLLRWVGVEILPALIPDV